MTTCETRAGLEQSMGYTPRAVGCGAPAGRSNKKVHNVCFPFQWHCSNKKGRGAQSFISDYFLLVDSSAVDISLVGSLSKEIDRVPTEPSRKKRILKPVKRRARADQ